MKILSPWMYEENGPPCYEFITSYPNLKIEAFRRECQRWYGLPDLPYSVANYQVFYCRRYPNGTTQYRADICCKGKSETVMPSIHLSIHPSIYPSVRPSVHSESNPSKNVTFSVVI